MDALINRTPVALMDDPGLEKQLPRQVTDCAVSLVYSSHMFYSTSTEGLANLLATCPNIQEVRISSRTLVDLPARVGHPLQRLRIVNLSSQLGLSDAEFTHLLDLVPNLRNADRLPPTLHALDGASLSKKKLDRLVLDPWHRTALPLLFSGHWTTRELTISVGEATWRYLQKIDPSGHVNALSATRTLAVVIIESPDSGPTPLLAVIAACRLRRLTLQARASDLADLLPAALRGVKTLKLRILFSPPSQITALVDVLSAALPGALHSLAISHLGGNIDYFEPLRPVCSANRIVLIIQE